MGAAGSKWVELIRSVLFIFCFTFICFIILALPLPYLANESGRFNARPCDGVVRKERQLSAPKCLSTIACWGWHLGPHTCISELFPSPQVLFFRGLVIYVGMRGDKPVPGCGVPLGGDGWQSL